MLLMATVWLFIVVPGLVASSWFDSLVGKGEYNYVDYVMEQKVVIVQ